LDRWLAARDDAPTRSQIAAAIGRGDVTVDGKVAKAAARLKGGERVVVAMLVQEPDGEVLAEDIALDVIYADDEFVAINKAAGMVVHPAAGHRAGTLVNAILHAYPPTGWSGAPDRAGIVHRLDRDTSGVILVARSVGAHEKLAAQFRKRSIEKEYAALVRGNVEKGGEIDAPIGRHPSERKKMSTAARQSRSALTVYEVDECFGVATLLKVKPHTGRTHQIRVHLAAQGWPVVGDKTYGALGPKTAAKLRKQWGKRADLLAGMPRQALHARRIAFDHPGDGRRMVLEAPFPDDLAELLGALRAASTPALR
jgi:23S rRNA pseudouridine1911/1915/1917 synthase